MASTRRLNPCFFFIPLLKNVWPSNAFACPLQQNGSVVGHMQVQAELENPVPTLSFFRLLERLHPAMMSELFPSCILAHYYKKCIKSIKSS